MNVQSLQLLEQYLTGQLPPDEARSAERLLARGDVEAGQGEALAVYAFLREMGPSQPPPALVARTCERIRSEAEDEPDTAAAQSRMHNIGAALSWSYRGPALAVSGPWSTNATRLSVRGLTMSRFALGPLGLTSLGRPRVAQSKAREPSVWRRLVEIMRAP